MLIVDVLLQSPRGRKRREEAVIRGGMSGPVIERPHVARSKPATWKCLSTDRDLNNIEQQNFERVLAPKTRGHHFIPILTQISGDKAVRHRDPVGSHQ
jgi:hypothetical protein